MNANSECLLNVEQFSAKLGIKPATTRAWILSGRIAHVKVGKRAVRIPASEVERIVNAGYIPAREERNGHS